jgi:hypothetical protein
MDKKDQVARALFAVDHPGRNFDADIREDEREEWRTYAQVAIDALATGTDVKPEPKKAMEYVPPKPIPPPDVAKTRYPQSPFSARKK